MANTAFYVPSLRDQGAWFDYRSKLPGGFGWRGERPFDSITRIVLHHSVTKKYSGLDKEVREIHRLHSKRGWGGIGYHFLIGSEEINGFAKTAYVGDVLSVRAHTPNTKGRPGSPPRQGNYYFIAIVFIGDHREELPTPPMYRSAHELIQELLVDKRFTKLSSFDQVEGHKHYDATFCPGNIIKIKEEIFKMTNPQTTPPPSLPVDHPDVKKAIEWNNKLPKKIFSNTSKENLERPVNNATLLVLLQRLYELIENKS